MSDLGLNGWQFVVQLVAFLVFVGLLWKYAVGPIVQMLDQRQQRISESMQAAQRMEEELKTAQARNEETLQQARREAQEILTSARQSSEQIIARAREEANGQAEEYLSRAQDTLRQETERARQQLRQELADLAVSAAGRILRKEIDPSTQTRLIEETLVDASRVSPN
ncbi:MAG TPA: F0F1 ATP synthase subunit B [Thermomicrobiales bacterium]|nr:F0F1 ATP synthase subunit B [Thermomicrobiales bacterium]